MKRRGLWYAPPSYLGLLGERRWEEGGVAQAWASWLVIQALYYARVPPPKLAALYRHIR